MEDTDDDSLQLFQEAALLGDDGDSFLLGGDDPSFEFDANDLPDFPDPAAANGCLAPATSSLPADFQDLTPDSAGSGRAGGQPEPAALNEDTAQRLHDMPDIDLNDDGWFVSSQPMQIDRGKSRGGSPGVSGLASGDGSALAAFLSTSQKFDQDLFPPTRPVLAPAGSLTPTSPLATTPPPYLPAERERPDSPPAGTPHSAEAAAAAADAAWAATMAAPAGSLEPLPLSPPPAADAEEELSPTAAAAHPSLARQLSLQLHEQRQQKLRRKEEQAKWATGEAPSVHVEAEEGSGAATTPEGGEGARAALRVEVPGDSPNSPSSSGEASLRTATEASPLALSSRDPSVYSPLSQLVSPDSLVVTPQDGAEAGAGSPDVWATAEKFTPGPEHLPAPPEQLPPPGQGAAEGGARAAGGSPPALPRLRLGAAHAAQQVALGEAEPGLLSHRGPVPGPGAEAGAAAGAGAGGEVRAGAGGQGGSPPGAEEAQQAPAGGGGGGCDAGAEAASEARSGPRSGARSGARSPMASLPNGIGAELLELKRTMSGPEDLIGRMVETHQAKQRSRAGTGDRLAPLPGGDAAPREGAAKQIAAPPALLQTGGGGLETRSSRAGSEALEAVLCATSIVYDLLHGVLQKVEANEEARAAEAALARGPQLAEARSLQVSDVDINIDQALPQRVDPPSDLATRPRCCGCVVS